MLLGGRRNNEDDDKTKAGRRTIPLNNLPCGTIVVRTFWYV